MYEFFREASSSAEPGAAPEQQRAVGGRSLRDPHQVPKAARLRRQAQVLQEGTLQT